VPSQNYYKVVCEPAETAVKIAPKTITMIHAKISTMPYAIAKHFFLQQVKKKP
jgi:hypothetical protein